MEDLGGNMCYIGSTTKDFLSKRMVEHRSKYKLFQSGVGNYISVFEVFDKYGLDNCRIVLIDLSPCESRDELHAREAYYIKAEECVNRVIPNRTKKEYYEDHKEQILLYRKEYQQKNRESIAIDKKEYYEANKEEFNKKCKQYHLDNKDSIKLKQSESINCSCGIKYTHGHKSRHIKTKFHLNHLNDNALNI